MNVAAPEGATRKDGLLPALAIFVPLALWPAATALAAWRAGEMAAFVLALTGVALAALPAAGVGLGAAWGRKVAEAFSLAGMVIAILYVLRNGVTLLAVPAVGCFVVYAFLSHERFRAADAAKAAKPEEPEHPLAWLKENVEAIAVAFIMALVIRCFCVEVFKIPSSSMEPTLLGDNDRRDGDRIMVTKLTYALQKIARFEPVVFKYPLNPMKNYIKRVVGLPDERLMLYKGNVYAQPAGSSGPFRIQRKPLRTQRSLWIPSWSMDRPPLQSRESFESYFTAEGSWTLKEGVLSGGGSRKSVFYSKAQINDGHIGGGSEQVGDLLWEGDLTLPEGSGTFWIRIEHDFGPFVLQLKPGGGSVLKQGEDRSKPLKSSSVPAGSAVHVEFMVYDGQAFVLFDGREQVHLVFQETYDEARRAPDRNGLSFGSEGIRFDLSGFRVAQDIHYKPKDHDVLTPSNPLPIPSQNYFMLGDNVNNSHDGRVWKRYVVRLKTGEVVEFESQEHITQYERKRAWAERRGRKEPYLLIGADKYGHERAIEKNEIADNGEETAQPFHFVESRFIIGRAFAVCWPLSRSLRMIR